MEEEKNKQSSSTLNQENVDLKEKAMLPKKIQQRISSTRILLINLNSCITEIAKILINKGFNIYLYDKEKVSQKDINNNFFLEKNDLGKSRLKAIYEKLVTLSATVSITMVNDFNNLRDLKITIAGFTDYNSLCTYEEFFTRKNIFFYSINNSGILGFYYNNLFINSRHGDKFADIDNMLFLKKSDKLLNDMKVNKTKPDKFHLSIFLLELYYRKNVDVKDIPKVMKEEYMNDYKFHKKMSFFEQYFRKIECEYIFRDKEIMSLLRRYIVNFNKEFNPICSMLSEIVCNEIYDYVIGKSLPRVGLITYDSENEIFDYNNLLE